MLLKLNIKSKLDLKRFDLSLNVFLLTVLPIYNK